MPIIKDKYGSKGAQQRPTYVRRDKNRAIIEPAPTGTSRQQQQELEKQAFRSAPKNKNLVSNPGVLVDSQSQVSSINHYTSNTANNPELLLTISAGKSLRNLIIHNANPTDNTITSIYWSTGNQSEASFTASGGVIASVTGVTVNQFFSYDMPANSTVSLQDILNIFNNPKDDIFMYIVTENIEVNVTYTRTSE